MEPTPILIAVSATTALTTVHTTPAGFVDKIDSIVAANVDTVTDAFVDLAVTKAGGTAVYRAKSASCPKNGGTNLVRGDTVLRLSEGESLGIRASANGDVNVVISGVRRQVTS